jgi:hypothetical protein
MMGPAMRISSLSAPAARIWPPGTLLRKISPLESCG